VQIEQGQANSHKPVKPSLLNGKDKFLRVSLFVKKMFNKTLSPRE